MWKIIQSSLCALLLYGATPSHEPLKVPPVRCQNIEYDITGKEVEGEKPVLGHVSWRYTSSRYGVVESDFEVKITDAFTKFVLGVDLTKVESTKIYLKKGPKTTKYSFTEMEGDKVKFKTGLSESREVTDLFVLLAEAIHVQDLEGLAKTGKQFPAYYSNFERDVGLREMEDGDKKVEFRGKSYPVVMYDVVNVSKILKNDSIKLILGLRKKHPHLMLHAKLGIPPIMLSLDLRNIQYYNSISKCRR